MRYICTSIVVTLMLAGTTWAATITVPDDYASIQAAIDASSDGDKFMYTPASTRMSTMASSSTPRARQSRSRRSMVPGPPSSMEAGSGVVVHSPMAR